MDSAKKTEIENFLGMSMPSGPVVPDVPNFVWPDVPNNEVRFLDRADIEKVLLERLPFYYIEKAVSLGKDDKRVVLTKAVITKDRCEGHFPPPLRTIAPFIEFFKACAQSGILMGSLLIPNHVPIANGEGHFKSYNKRFIFAPVDVMVESKVDSWLEYGTKMVGNTMIYAQNTAVAQLWTEYILINKPVFERLIRDKRTAP